MVNKEGIEGTFCKGEWMPWPRLAKLLPVAFVLVIGSIIYTIYVLFHCIPMLQFDIEKKYRDEEALREAVWSLVYVHFFGALFLLSFILTCVTDPGGIPNRERWLYNPKKPNLQEIKKTKAEGQLRYCEREKKFKPDRAHYCRPLDRNVLKMDHYCPWVANCIGHYNYKFFFLALLYSAFLTVYVGVTLTKALVPMFDNPNISFAHLYYVFLGDTLSIFLSCVIIPFFSFHVLLMIKNTTTVEYCAQQQGLFKWTSDYSVNWLHNIRAALGTNVFLWFIPIGGPEGDGLEFIRYSTIMGNTPPPSPRIDDWITNPTYHPDSFFKGRTPGQSNTWSDESKNSEPH